MGEEGRGEEGGEGRGGEMSTLVCATHMRNIPIQLQGKFVFRAIIMNNCCW